MRTDAFDYELPPELIAQRPAERRDESRMLVALRDDDAIGHRRFADLPELLRAGDLLVLNDARVLPARLHARRATGGRVELLVIAPVPGRDRRWRALMKPARRVRPGDTLTLEAGPTGVDDGDAVALTVVDALPDGSRVVEFPAAPDVVELLERRGEMPLPHYIERGEHDPREAIDRERYQTVYASTPGAVAAPTAGLHFTESLLERLRERGVELATITLHVGPGTFRPVTADRVEEHRMDAELYRIPEATAAAVVRARAEGRRVIAVGTTVTRTLEYAAALPGGLAAGIGDADLFIHPGYRFRAIDGMITNFHLPRSTPILLVAALLGRERLLEAYRQAVERRYRFYSYGDAMLVLPRETRDAHGSEQ
jgi:S-adenosylmethionine:tRNA ribosyltransferase-isomerase